MSVTLSHGQAESRDLPEKACGGGQQVETGLSPQTQSSKSSVDCQHLKEIINFCITSDKPV